MSDNNDVDAMRFRRVARDILGIVRNNKAHPGVVTAALIEVMMIVLVTHTENVAAAERGVDVICESLREAILAHDATKPADAFIQ